MKVIGLFAVFVVILDATAVGICSIIERYSELGSLFSFLGLFVVNFIIAWQAALFITERYLVSDSQRKANEENVKWVRSHLVGARR
jgi:hypothetical protein